MLKRLLLLGLCLMLPVACIACGDTEQPTRPTTNAEEENYPTVYVADETINRFILALKERSSLTIQHIEHGTVSGEYILTMSDCRVTLSTHQYGLGVAILGERDAGAQERLFDVFTQLAWSADKSCTREQVLNAIAFMKQQTTASESYRVSNDVKILCYSPSVQVGGTTTPHRLDMLLTGYLPTAE